VPEHLRGPRTRSRGQQPSSAVTPETRTDTRSARAEPAMVPKRAHVPWIQVIARSLALIDATTERAVPMDRDTFTLQVVPHPSAMAGTRGCLSANHTPRSIEPLSILNPDKNTAQVEIHYSTTAPSIPAIAAKAPTEASDNHEVANAQANGRVCTIHPRGTQPNMQSPRHLCTNPRTVLFLLCAERGEGKVAPSPLQPEDVHLLERTLPPARVFLARQVSCNVCANRGSRLHGVGNHRVHGSASEACRSKRWNSFRGFEILSLGA